jgi:hypothetical protein
MLKCSLMPVIFSLRDGDVWINFTHNRAAIKVGKHDEIAAAMRDFLMQGQIANRLLREATTVGKKSQAAS